MKKTATVIAAGLLLAACTATQNTAENSPAAQSAQNPAWDKQYGGADKSYDSRLLALREQIAPRFEVLTFKAPQTDKEMQYNLYTPKKTLNQTCRQYAGLTAKQFINQRILLESKRLLAYTKASVKEIAWQLGFEEASHFGKFFKKEMQKTPLAFRKEFERS